MNHLENFPFSVMGERECCPATDPEMDRNHVREAEQAISLLELASNIVTKMQEAIRW